MAGYGLFSYVFTLPFGLFGAGVHGVGLVLGVN